MATATYYKEEVTALLKAKSFAKLLFNSVVLVNIGAILIIASVDLLRLSQVLPYFQVNSADIVAGIEGGLIAAYLGIIMHLISLIYLRQSI